MSSAIEDILGAQLVFDADNSFDFQSLSKRFRENAEKVII